MAHALISRACANFLSDVNLKPGSAQSGGGVNAAQRQQLRFVDRTLLESNCYMHVKTRGLVRGSLTHARPADRAVLDLKYQWCRYREHLTGVSCLTLFEVHVPEQVCAGLPRDTYRLSEIIDFSGYKPWFFIRADPVIRSMRNVTRKRDIDHKRQALDSGLLITMVDHWSRENWSYWSQEHGYRDRMA